MAIEIIRLNLIPEGNPPVVHCKQYDNGRVFQIVLYNGKDPYILTTETIELNIRKSDRHIVTADLPFVVGEHCVDVTTTEQMCAVAGKNTAEIRIIRDGINIGTLNFFMQIERSPMENGLESDSEINNLARQVHDNVVRELADHGAKETGYDNTESELEATNVQDAIDEVNEKIENIPTIDAYTKEETDNKFATKESLETLSGVVDGKANTTDVNNALAQKMDKANPTGTGSLSLNRKAGSTVGSNSVALGTNTRATGTSTTALGNDTLAYGENSVAIGSGSSVSGTNSVAIGNHTKANSNTQFVFGKYNKDDNNNAYAEIVGNGTTVFTKSNARTLDWQGNETLAGNLTFNGNKSLTSEIQRLDNRINSLPNPVIFQGTLGVGGTITELPVASAENDGYMYKVITAGTYQEIECKVGDALISKSTEWVLIPAGDEDTDTWRNIKVNGTEVLGNGISSGSADFVGSENIDVEFDNDGNKIGIKTKNIYTKAEVDDIVYNILPDDTASGSVANFDTSLELPIKSLEVDVNAVQEAGTPTPASPLPISGWSQVEITQSGANLWNEQVLNGYLNASDGLYISYANCICSKDFCKCEPSENYYSKSFSSPALYIYWYDKDFAFISRTQGNNVVVNAPNNACYFKISCYNYGSTYNNDVSLNCPSSDTTYHAYNGSTTLINLGGTYYGGHFTQDKDGHRQFEVTHAKEHISLQDRTPSTASGYDRYSIPISSETTAGGLSAGKKCSVLESYAYSDARTSEHFYLYSTSLIVFFVENTFRNGEFDVMYPLATPYVIDLPDGEPINTLAGVNNFFADTGDTEVEYKESADKYVEKKLDETCYTKSEDDTFLNAKADKSTTYTKTEVNSLLNGKAKAPTVITGTLIAGQTSVTLQSSAITNNSTIFVYTTDGTEWNTITVTTGQVVITFDAQASDLGVKVEVT